MVSNCITVFRLPLTLFPDHCTNSCVSRELRLDSYCTGFNSQPKFPIIGKVCRCSARAQGKVPGKYPTTPPTFDPSLG